MKPKCIQTNCPSGYFALIEVVYNFPYKSPALADKNTILNDIWRKLASQPSEITTQFWTILESKLTVAEPFGASSTPQTSRRSSSKVKIVNAGYLALIGATKEVCSQIDSQILIDRLPKTLR